VRRKLPAGKTKRPSYEHEKISLAVAEECAETGMAIEKFLALSPIEKRTRLAARMTKWGFTQTEVPSERVFRDFWRNLRSHQFVAGPVLETAR
jgi:hypothetical protein